MFCIDILLNILKAATEDEGFHLPSKEANEALKLAQAIYEWATRKMVPIAGRAGSFLDF